MTITDDTFVYNGKNVYELARLKMVLCDVFSPKFRERKIVVPRRSGAVRPKAIAHEEREIRMTCTIEDFISIEQFDDLKYLLSREGRIMFPSIPGRYLIGQCFDAAEVLDYQDYCMRDFELRFICHPYWHAVDPMERTASERAMWFNTDDNRYRGSWETPTRITLRNTGSAPISGITITRRKTVY